MLADIASIYVPGYDINKIRTGAQMHTMIAIKKGKCISDDISTYFRLARDDKNLGSKNFTTCEIASTGEDSRIILYDMLSSVK